MRRPRLASCTLAANNGDCVLEIQDDGRGGSLLEGNGLRGMRERVEALGGTITRDMSAGTTLTIRISAGSEREALNPPAKTARKTIRVVIAEDQGMILGALASLLEIEGDITRRWPGAQRR